MAWSQNAAFDAGGGGEPGGERERRRGAMAWSRNSGGEPGDEAERRRGTPVWSRNAAFDVGSGGEPEPEGERVRGRGREREPGAVALSVAGAEAGEDDAQGGAQAWAVNMTSGPRSAAPAARSGGASMGRMLDAAAAARLTPLE